MLGFGKKKRPTGSLDDFDIPSFPTAVLGLLGKLRDPEISINELAADLETDPGLHVRVLKTVNSAAFGLSHKVSNISHAVNLLGRGRLESLVLSVAVKDNLTRNNQSDWLNMSQFWATAARRAAIARGLATILHPHVQSDVFTIGLLQDMAVPILANREGDDYRDIYLAWRDTENFDLIEQEQKSFGTNHATLGGQMAENWGFPASLANAIGGHHSGESPENVPLSVRVAALIKDHPESDDSSKLAQQAQQLFGLEGLTAEVIEELLQESQELAAALN